MKIEFPAIKRWFGITQQHDENACEERFDILLFRTQFSVVLPAGKAPKIDAWAGDESFLDRRPFVNTEQATKSLSDLPPLSYGDYFYGASWTLQCDPVLACTSELNFYMGHTLVTENDVLAFPDVQDSEIALAWLHHKEQKRHERCNYALQQHDDGILEIIPTETENSISNEISIAPRQDITIHNINGYTVLKIQHSKNCCEYCLPYKAANFVNFNFTINSDDTLTDTQKRSAIEQSEKIVQDILNSISIKNPDTKILEN